MECSNRIDLVTTTGFINALESVVAIALNGCEAAACWFAKKCENILRNI
jgi:hypothetical protein